MTEPSTDDADSNADIDINVDIDIDIEARYAERQLTARPSAELVEQLRGCSAADVSDSLVALGARNHVIRGVHALAAEPGRPIQLLGVAVTLDFVPANGTHDFSEAPFLSSEVIRRMSPGDVLVMSAKGCDYAFWGGHMARRAVDKQLGGAVVDAQIRDVREIRETGLPLFALGTTPQTLLSHYEAVAYNTTIECGGATVTPGDAVIGDEDGVVVVPQLLLPELIVELRKREKLEQWMAEAVASDSPAHEIYTEILRRRPQDEDEER
ncbi:MAG TPA: hypothetical protein VGF95_01995 [Solirubrobacteraceae bacterium]|jgi:4-hydroxy-4-methyl-2-oxoglutarate aldolase